MVPQPSARQVPGGEAKLGRTALPSGILGAVLISAIGGCDLITEPDRMEPQAVVAELRIADRVAEFVGSPLPEPSATAAPISHSAHFLADRSTVMVEVEVEPGTTEILVSVSPRSAEYLITAAYSDQATGHYRVSVDGLSVAPQGAQSSETTSPAAEASADARQGQVYTVFVQLTQVVGFNLSLATRGPSGSSPHLQYQFAGTSSAGPTGLASIDALNSAIAGVWQRTGNCCRRYLAQTLTLSKTHAGGGIWQSGTWTLEYAIGVNDSGGVDYNADGSFSILLIDGNGNLLITYAVKLQGTQITFSNIASGGVYDRVSGQVPITPRPVPITPVPGGQTVVPSVLGLSQGAAAATILNAGLVLGPITSRADPSPGGTIVGQAPPGGTQVPSGSAVSLTVSEGKNVLLVEPKRQEVWANDIELLEVTVRAFNQLGFPVPGLQVALSSPVPGVTVSPLASNTTDNQGEALFTVRGDQLGSIQLDAVDINDLTATGSAVVTFVKRRAVVLVQGIRTTLDASAIGSVFPQIHARLLALGFSRPVFGPVAESGAQCADGQDSDGDGSADDGCPLILPFSYRGGTVGPFTGTWAPNNYACGDTRNSIASSMRRLDDLLTDFARANPNTKLAVIGHSQGGLLSLQSLETARGGGADVDVVVTLDGALGGTPPLGTAVTAAFSCWGSPASDDLVSLYRTVSASDRSRQGSAALATGIRNSDLVLQAQQAGIRTVTVGSLNDCVFRPSECQIPTTDPDNTSSQMIETATTHLLPLGGNCSVGTICLEPSHSQVLQHPQVLSIIQNAIGSPTSTSDVALSELLGTRVLHSDPVLASGGER